MDSTLLNRWLLLACLSVTSLIAWQWLKPGERFEYSNSNFILPGGIVESLAGQRYEESLREHLFMKAGMNHTFLDFASWTGNAPATGYTEFSSDGYWVRQATSRDRDPTNLAIGG